MMSPVSWVKAKVCRYLIILSLITVQACAMETSQKHIELEVHSQGVWYFINFNGAKIFVDRNKDVVSQVVPVNQWIVSGLNKIDVSVNFETASEEQKNALSKEVELTVSVYVREKNAGAEKRYLISSFDLSPSAEDVDRPGSSSTLAGTFDSEDFYRKSDSGNITASNWVAKSKKKWTVFSLDLGINIDPPKWAFESADDLGDDQTMSDDEYYGLIDELYKEYKAIWLLHEKRDLDSLMSRLSLRASEYDKAFFLESGSKLNELKRSLAGAFNHDSLELGQMVGKNQVTLRTIEGNRIAQLTVEKVGEPLIFYSHPEGHFTRLYDMYFMRKNGKWIVIR